MNEFKTGDTVKLLEGSDIDQQFTIVDIFVDNAKIQSNPHFLPKKAQWLHLNQLEKIESVNPEQLINVLINTVTALCDNGIPSDLIRRTIELTLIDKQNSVNSEEKNELVDKFVNQFLNCTNSSLVKCRLHNLIAQARGLQD